MDPVFIKWAAVTTIWMVIAITATGCSKPYVKKTETGVCASLDPTYCSSEPRPR